MKTQTVHELIEVLEETAFFLKRLNWKWFKELENLAFEGRKLMGEEDQNKIQEWNQRVYFYLEGENQLSSLFVSAPDKREFFKALKLKWKQKLAAMDSLI